MPSYALSSKCPGGHTPDVRADILRRPQHVRKVSALPDPTRPDPTRIYLPQLCLWSLPVQFYFQSKVSRREANWIGAKR